MNDRTPHVRTLDVDPFTGIETRFHWHGDGTFTIEDTQDVEDILEHNKKLYTDDDRGWFPSREFRRVASIPLTVVYDMMIKGLNIFDMNDTRQLRRYLNDPEVRLFRTAPGRL